MKSNRQKIEKGDIVLIPFPFTDLNAVKTRPALVVWVDPQYNDFILMGITSKSSGDHKFPITTKNLNEGSLPKKSYVRYAKIATLNRSIVKRKVGRLEAAIFGQLIDKFLVLFNR